MDHALAEMIEEPQRLGRKVKFIATVLRPTDGEQVMDRRCSRGGSGAGGGSWATPETV